MVIKIENLRGKFLFILIIYYWDFSFSMLKCVFIEFNDKCVRKIKIFIFGRLFFRKIKLRILLNFWCILFIVKLFINYYKGY